MLRRKAGRPLTRARRNIDAELLYFIIRHGLSTFTEIWRGTRIWRNDLYRRLKSMVEGRILEERKGILVKIVRGKREEVAPDIRGNLGQQLVNLSRFERRQQKLLGLYDRPRAVWENKRSKTLDRRVKVWALTGYSDKRYYAIADQYVNRRIRFRPVSDRIDGFVISAGRPSEQDEKIMMDLSTELLRANNKKTPKYLRVWNMIYCVRKVAQQLTSV